VVRYGAMEYTDRFELSEESLLPGDHVILRTERGVEWGAVMTTAPVADDSQDKGKVSTGQILRKATVDDADKQRDIEEHTQVEEFNYCKELITKHKLPMKLLMVEHLFGGHRVVFFFMADGRVDFRRLVKDLAMKYHARIEMRQIGVRDETKLLGLFGPCGRELCCRTFLQALQPVPMKLAKSQKSTLDPAKISGRCGRLRCCLRFEQAVYDELKRELPRRGARVTTPKGRGVVVDYEIIPQRVEVELEEGGKERFTIADIALQEDREEN